MNFQELSEAMKDPAKRAGLMPQLMSNVRVLEDEFGEQFKVLRLGDVNMPLESVTREGGRTFRDISTTAFRADDVMVASFPKTGTHWMNNIMHFLYQTGPLEDIVSAAPTLLELFTEEEVEALPSPRILTTHMRPDMLPKDFFKNNRKVVLICRNPKDTAVSLFHHLKKERLISSGLRISWNCFIENWMNGFLPPMDYFLYHELWQNFLEENKEVDVLVVHYENIKKDGIKELRRLQAYLGFNHSDERLQQVLDRCSLGSLKADVDNKKVFSPLTDDDGKSILYRKGIIGDWKNHFTVAQSDKMDDIIASKFKNSMFNWQAKS